MGQSGDVGCQNDALITGSRKRVFPGKYSSGHEKEASSIKQQREEE